MAFLNLAEALVKSAPFRRFCNEERPHSSLGGTTPAQVARAVLMNPAWGCKRLAPEMERLLKLQESALEGAELYPERLNPCYGIRHVESSRRGVLACFDSFFGEL